MNHHTLKPLLAGLLLWTSLPAEAADKENTQPGPTEDAHSVSKKVLPSDVLPSLPDWKITLPVDAKGKDSSAASEVDKRNRKPREVIDDALTGFEMPPYFYARGGEVFFRAHCGGATTKGSKYPRCELRQRVGGGNGYWSMQDHQKLVTELRVTKTPAQKPEVCMVQIHGPDDEPMRLQYHARTGLHLIWNESHKKKFSNEVPYTLGQRLRVTTEVDKGRITCTVLNLDNQKQFTHTWTAVDKAGYFKLGCYTQSSIFLSQFKNGMKDEESDAYGEVAVSKIELTETFRK